MKTRSLSTSFALAAFAIASAVPAPTFARVPHVAQQSAVPVTGAQGGYIKALPGENGIPRAAQTAIRRFNPIQGNGPSIYLVAAIHVGEKSYYQQIQQFLDKQDVVLYEGVRSSRGAAKTKSVGVAGAHASGVAKRPVGIQKKMSGALNLQFQMEGIHYDRPQFRNSDLDWDSMNLLATKAGPETQQLLTELKNSVSGGPIVTQNDQILDKVLTLSASTPLVSTMLRRLLITALCDPSKLRAMMGLKQDGTPDSAKKLDLILINERNQVVLVNLKALLKASKKMPKPIHSIAVFYGAAHMKNIEQHLVSDLGYRDAGAQWITAIQANH